MLQVLDRMNRTEIETWILSGVDSQKCRNDTLGLLYFNESALPAGDFLPAHFGSLLGSHKTVYSASLAAESRKDAASDFEHCFKVNVNDVSGSRSGKYCLSVINPKGSDNNDTNFPLLFGSCQPSSCSNEDISTIAQNTLNVLNGSSTFAYRLLECVAQNENELDAWDIFVLVVLGLLLVLAVFSLLWDCGNLEGRHTFGRRFLASFSLKRNIFTWLKANDAEFAPAINGILFLTVAWIILSNAWDLPFSAFYFLELQGLTPEIVIFQQDYSDWSQLLISNGHVALDTLFTISGVMISYSILNELDLFDGKGGVYLYVKILMRLTPTYLLVVGFMATIFRFFGDGPLSSLIHHASKNCASNGWKNILYVNNFGNATTENMCLPDSWYFAVEMQFLLLSPVLLYIVWKYRKIGLGFLTLLILGSIAIPAIVTFDQNFLPAAIPTRNYQSYFTDFYILPWNRASPFLVGIACGYLLRITGKRCKLSKALIMAGWLLSTAVTLSIIFGLFPYYNPKITIPSAEAAVYAGFHRFAWGVAMAWIIFACSRGLGGWISSILSWRFFVPLGSVSMIAFLVSLPVQFVHHFRIRPILYPDTYTKVNLFVADLVISYFVAILLAILVAIPSEQIATYLRPREKEHDDDIDGMEMKPKAERYGIYYNKDVSICMDTSKGNRRRSPSVSQYPRRQRYGIYYDNDVSISMERIK